uniref:Uncharacterized protein n=1 Tax=Arundo donax TaxID=35708 RepID=A0A0A8ZYR9_ARUDO
MPLDGDVMVVAEKGQRHLQPLKLLTMEELNAKETEVLQKLFMIKAASLHEELRNTLAGQVHSTVQESITHVHSWMQHLQDAQTRWMKEANNYITKACSLADRLCGNEAWFATPVVPSQTPR